jgi:HEAT repeat protein
MVTLLGQAPSKTSLAAVRTALKDTDTEVQTAAIKALGNWSDASPAADLLAIAKTDTSAQQIAALRGFIRLASLGEMPAADRTKMYADALAAAKRPEDKSMALSEMGNSPSPAALAVIRPLLAGDSKNEAAAAIIKIATAVAAKAPAEAKAALQDVAASSANDNMKRQATQALTGLGGSPR